MTPRLDAPLRGYWDFLRDRTELRDIDGWVEVTTPFVDRHNDQIQLYVREEDGRYLLTDDSATIQDLRHSGRDLKSKRRQEILRLTLSGFGVGLDGDALAVHARTADFPIKKHNLIQAILAVNDLFHIATPAVSNLFWEDVAEWLRGADIRFIERVRFGVRSGFDHIFDFAIPASRQAPLRVVEAISRPTRSAAQNLAFAWLETQETRGADGKAFAMLNDTEMQPAGDVIEALRAYDVQPVLWSERESVRPALAA